MVSEYPIYCPVCGDVGESTYRGLNWRRNIFQYFLKLFGARWRGKVFSFCEECRNQLILLSDLQWELQDLKQRLTYQRKELENKLKSSEATFERSSLYSRDKRYFKLRRQLLGDKVLPPEPLPGDYLNGRKIPLELERRPPVPLECFGVVIEEPQVETEFDENPNINHDGYDDHEQVEEPQDEVEFYHTTSLNYGDYEQMEAPQDEVEFYLSPRLNYDDYEQMEEPDQPESPHVNENLFQSTSAESFPEFYHPPHPTTMGRRVEIYSDTTSEGNEEGAPETTPLTPPSLSKRTKRKRRRRQISDTASDFQQEESNEEVAPAQKKSAGGKMKRSSNMRVPKDKRIVTICNIQLIKLSEEEDKYKCSECDAILLNKRHILRTHVIKEHTTRYECSQCFRRFGQSNHLSRHMLTCQKTTAPQFSCPICARPFFRADDVKCHVWSHYSEQELADVVARGGKLPKRLFKNSFSCDQCLRSFATSGTLEKHITDGHGDGKIVEKEICGLCGARVVSVKRHMKLKHVSEEDKKFECGICKIRFVHNSRLIHHRKVAHSNFYIKPFKCNVCGRTFKFELNLKDHLFVHADVKPFNCSLCRKGFPRRSTLQRHVASVHEGKKRSDTKKKQQGSNVIDNQIAPVSEDQR